MHLPDQKLTALAIILYNSESRSRRNTLKPFWVMGPKQTSETEDSDNTVVDVSR